VESTDITDSPVNISPNTLVLPGTENIPPIKSRSLYPTKSDILK